MIRIAEMRSKALRLNYERGIDMVILDYLQLMQGEGGGRGENRVQEIGFVSRSLKALAREIDAPVLAVPQRSRAVEWRASHEPQLSDLREAGSIEQDADVVLFIYRDEYYYKNEEEWIAAHRTRNTRARWPMSLSPSTATAPPAASSCVSARTSPGSRVWAPRSCRWYETFRRFPLW